MSQTTVGWVGVVGFTVALNGFMVLIFALMARRYRRRSAWRCPVCHRFDHVGGFCWRDGAKLEPNPLVAERKCPHCGLEHQKRQAVYCWHCGKKLTEVREKQVA